MKSYTIILPNKMVIALEAAAIRRQGGEFLFFSEPGCGALSNFATAPEGSMVMEDAGKRGFKIVGK